MQPTIPVVILGGSDRRPTELPAAGRDKHPLSGYKGVDVRIGGRPLVAEVADRLRRAGGFGPIHVVGPRRLYGPVEGLDQVIDSDRSFGRNIRAAIETLRVSLKPERIAFITCDVLPDTQSLVELLERHRRDGPSDLWFPMVRAPADPAKLGVSAWKPAYSIVLHPGEPATRVLPGHLALADPEALRLSFLYRLIDLGYRTRNRSISYRRSVMVRGVLFALLYQDLRHVLERRAPTLTWSVLGAGISAARELRAGTITQERLERALRRIFVTSRHRRRHPERRVRLPIVDALSLALDIDTEEEARQLGGDLESRSA